MTEELGILTKKLFWIRPETALRRGGGKVFG